MTGSFQGATLRRISLLHDEGMFGKEGKFAKS
jgi:hypothetical protein